MGDPAARPKPAISRAEWGLLLLLAAVQFTNILDFVIIMPLAPLAKRDFGINSTQFGHVVAAYGFASFAGSILAANFLDRFGRKTALLTLYLGFTISTLLCGLAPTYETLVGARALAGLFGGVVGSAVYAIVGDVFADYRRGTATGVIMSSFAVASIVGVPIGLMLAEAFGTGAPFIALAGAAAVVWVGNFFVLPSLREHLAHGHPPASLVRLALEPNHQLAFAFSVSLVFGSFTIVPFLADSLVANAGQKVENLKYVYVVAGLATLVSMNVIGRWADHAGKLLVFRIMATAAIATALLLTNLPPVPLWVAIAGSTAFMVATSGRMVPAQAMLTGAAAPAVRGGFLSLNAAVQSAAMGLASLIAGLLINQDPATGRLNGYPVVGLLAAGSALVSLLLGGFLRRADATPTPIPARDGPAVAEAAA
ncbi:MAG TPA: MFS transporter [Gemmataceae bacterium]|nr:MFS transporter [Gemmataceae bacterium]